MQVVVDWLCKLGVGGSLRYGVDGVVGKDGVGLS